MTATEHVATLMARLGRDGDEITHVQDALQVGPIEHRIPDYEARAAWWREVMGPAGVAPDDRPLWEKLRADARDVVVWHGPHPQEYLVMLMVCDLLRRTPRRLHEVRLRALRQTGPWLPAFFRAVGVSERDLERAWPTRRRIRDVSQRADRWCRVTSRTGAWIRELRRDAVVHKPVAALDDVLIAPARTKWMAPRRLLGRTLVDYPVTHGLLAWRLRVLLEQGLLEGQGWDEKWQLPAELRVTQPLSS